MALEKRVPLSESKSFEFRLEAFNAINHAQSYWLAAVDGNISSSAFGRPMNSALPRLVQIEIKLFY